MVPSGVPGPLLPRMSWEGPAGGWQRVQRPREQGGGPRDPGGLLRVLCRDSRIFTSRSSRVLQPDEARCLVLFQVLGLGGSSPELLCAGHGAPVTPV